MNLLAPTPREALLDAQGRPYFLWDVDMTLEEFLDKLKFEDREIRGYWLGKLMRQAKPDDVFQWVTLREVVDSWSDVERYLGKSREFWAWILRMWGERVDA